MDIRVNEKPAGIIVKMPAARGNPVPRLTSDHSSQQEMRTYFASIVRLFDIQSPFFYSLELCCNDNLSDLQAYLKKEKWASESIIFFHPHAHNLTNSF